MDVFDHFWLGLVFIAVAGVPSWFAARNHKGISDIKNQVVNGHKSPMRSDLDLVIKGLDDLGTDVRGLRQDLAMEEDRRRAAVADLYTELDHRTGRHRRQEP
jgi:hypothetical protein